MDLQTIAEGKYLRLRRAGRWEYAERIQCSGVVIIVPILADGRILLVEQYRAPVDKQVIEFPAGLVGDDEQHRDELVIDAARRELLEETGYEAAELLNLGSASASAGLTSETATFCLARGLRKVSDKLGVGTEQITLHDIPLRELRNWLSQRAESHSIGASLYAALYLAQHVEPRLRA